MQRFSDAVITVAQDSRNLIPFPNANVTVYVTGTSDIADIYSQNVPSAVASNPFESDAFGNIDFYARNGRYDIIINREGLSPVVLPDVQFFDPDDFDYPAVVDPIIDEKISASFISIEDVATESATYPAAELERPEAAGRFGYQLAAPGAIGRTVAAKASEFVSPEDFGAKGDGSNDTVAMRAWLAYLGETGAQGILMAKNYFTQTLQLVGGTKGLRIMGPGYLGCTISRFGGGDAAVMRIHHTPGVNVEGFKLDGRHSTLGNTSIGLTLLNCPHSVVRSVWAHDTGTLGMLAYHPNGPQDDLSYLVDDVHFVSCFASLTTGGGIQMVGHKNSGQSGCFGENVGTTAVYFKCPVKNCYSTDNSAKDCERGFSIGSDYGTEQKAEGLTFSGMRAQNVRTFFRSYNMYDSVIQGATGSLNGDNADGLGDGIRLENSFRNTASGIAISRIGSSRAAARFTNGSRDNRISLLSATDGVPGSRHAIYGAGTGDNVVTTEIALSQTTVNRYENMGDPTNKYIESRTFVATFANVDVATITHDLRYLGIPYERMRVSYSVPPPGPAVFEEVTQNTFRVRFASPYTGTVTCLLAA